MFQLEKEKDVAYFLWHQGLSLNQSRMFQEKIMSIVDETYSSHPYQLVLVYASSGCPFQELALDLENLLEANMRTVITGDFNFDKRETNALSKLLKKRKFVQLVDWPTHKEGRTIDHCYVSENTRVVITRHSPYYSDHDALCIEFQNLHDARGFDFIDV